MASAASGGVVTGELILDTSKFIANYDKAMQHVQQKASQMGSMGNPIASSMQKAEKAVNNSLNSIENAVNRTVSRTGKAGSNFLSKMELQTKYWAKDIGNSFQSTFDQIGQFKGFSRIYNDLQNVNQSAINASKNLRELWDIQARGAGQAGKNASFLPLEDIWKAESAVAQLNKQVLEAQSSFAGMGRSFTANNSLMAEASRQLGQSFVNSIGNANKAEAAIANMLQAPAKYVPAAEAALYNFSHQSAAGMQNLSRQMDALQSSYIKNYTASQRLGNASTQLGRSFVEALGNANKAEAAISRMLQTPAKYVPKAASEMYNFNYQAQAGFRNLESQALANAQRISSDWDSKIYKMQNSTNAGTRYMGNTLNTINRSVNFNALSSKFQGTMRSMATTAQSTATSIKNSLTKGMNATDYMAAIMGGVVGQQVWDYGMARATTQQLLSSKGAAGDTMYQGYQKYTIASSTSDADINRMFQYVMISPGLNPNDTYRGLASINAASYSPDPTQRYRDMLAYGRYIQGGWDNAGKALLDEGLSETQINAMKAAKTPEERMAMLEQIAQSRGAMNQYGQDISTLTTGPMANFNKVLVISDSLMRGMVAGFNTLLNALSPLMDWFINLDSGTQTLIGQFIFFTGVLLVGISVLPILTSVLSPLWTGLMLLGKVILRYVIPAILKMNISMLTNPYLWVAIAIVGLVVVIYELGKAWGWWTDLAGFGAAIMARLTGVWNIMVDAIDQVTWALAPLAQIWTIITSAFYDSQGNWLGLFQGLMNINWGSIFSTIQTVMNNLGTMIYHWIRGGITGIGGVFGIQELLFGWTYGDGSQTQGIITRVYNFITSIDWANVIMSAMTTVAQTIANYNLMTLLITAIFGTQAGNAYSSQLMQGFFAIINGLTWIAGAIGNTISFFSPAFNTIYNIFAGFYNGATIIWNALLIILTGVWNALVAAGTSLWTSLQGVITPLINIFQILWNAVSVIWANIVNAWNLFTGAFFNSEGKWLGIIPGIANAFGLLWNWLATMDWAGVGTAILNGLMSIAGNLGSAFVSLILAIPNALGSAASSLGTSIYNWFVTTDWMGLFTQLGQFLISLNPITIIWNAIFGTGDSGKGGTGGQGGSGGNSIASQVTNSFLGVDWAGVFTQIAQTIASYNPLTLIITALFGTDAGNTFSNMVMNLFSGIGNIFSLIGQFLFGGGAQQAGGAITSWIGNLAAQIPGAISTLISNIASWIAAAVPNFLNILFTLIGHYNPITLITVLIFGPEAGQQVQNQTVQFLWGIVNTFMRGLTVLYNTIVLVGTAIYNYFSWVWNIIYTVTTFLWNAIYLFLTTTWNFIYTNAMFVWNAIYLFLTTLWNMIYFNVMFVWNALYLFLMNTWNFIYMNALLIWNMIYAFFTTIWNGIYFGAMWVWNNVFLVIYTNLVNIWNIAVGIGTAIWSTLSGVFRNIYNTVKPIFDKISSAFGGMRDGLTSAANTIRDNVWGPIKTLYDRLKGFWDWITHPFGGGGSSGGNAGSRNAGPRPTGYSGTGSRNNAGGLFAGIRDAAFSRTASLTGHMPQYAGPRPLSSNGENERLQYQCGEEGPCYAGGAYDFSQTWIDEAVKLVKGWSMNINGTPFKLETLAQSGNLGVFNAVASKLIGGTHYDYYYNHKYTPAQIINQTHACNCWDGAMLLLTLASKMGLPASMGKGKWGADDHVWAIIAGQVFDTTAYQRGYGWRAPQVNYGGASITRTPNSTPVDTSRNYTGPNPKPKEIHLYLHEEEKIRKIAIDVVNNESVDLDSF